MFVPFSILMMPLVKQTAHMGLGNRAGVILLYLVFYMPMNVLLYSGYLKNIPIALEEAADIDGASTWTTYWKVVFPMMMPMHATVAILTALGTWNDVMTPLVIMSGTGQNTLPLAQLNFQTQFGTNYNLAFASYILALIPILIFYVICQKQILNGVAAHPANMCGPCQLHKDFRKIHGLHRLKHNPWGCLFYLHSTDAADIPVDRPASDKLYALPQEYPSIGTGNYRILR